MSLTGRSTSVAEIFGADGDRAVHEIRVAPDDLHRIKLTEDFLRSRS